MKEIAGFLTTFIFVFLLLIVIKSHKREIGIIESIGMEARVIKERFDKGYETKEDTITGINTEGLKEGCIVVLNKDGSMRMATASEQDYFDSLGIVINDSTVKTLPFSDSLGMATQIGKVRDIN